MILHIDEIDGFRGLLTLTGSGLEAPPIFQWRGTLAAALDWAGQEVTLAGPPAALTAEWSGTAPEPEPPTNDPTSPDYRLEDRRRAIALANRERQNVRTHACTEDADLMRIAQAHAYDMWSRGYFSHRSPEGTGFGDRLQEAGYRHWSAAENLTSVQVSKPERAIQRWMESDDHRENMLHRLFRQMGIGVAAGLWVMMLAWRRI